MGFTSSECPSVWGYPAAAFKPGLIKCQIGGASALKGEGQGYQIDLKSWEGEWRTNALVMNEINLHCNNIGIGRHSLCVSLGKKYYQLELST